MNIITLKIFFLSQHNLRLILHNCRPYTINIKNQKGHYISNWQQKVESNKTKRTTEFSIIEQQRKGGERERMTLLKKERK